MNTSIKNSTFKIKSNSKSRVEYSTAGLKLLPEESLSKISLLCLLKRKRGKFSKIFGII